MWGIGPVFRDLLRASRYTEIWWKFGAIDGGCGGAI
jgi:hypothetical protein